MAADAGFEGWVDDRVDLDDLVADLSAIEGVADVHDVHVWTLTADMEAASGHLMVADGTDSHSVFDQARHLLADRYGVEHGTFQVEPDTHLGCAEVTW